MTQAHPAGAPDRADFISLGVCTLIWGTTWLVLKWQLDSVDPVASVVWRFGLSGVLILGLSAARGRTIALSLRQHGLAAAQGGLVFGLGYGMVYAGEGKISSALAAVVFASLSLVNTAVFRVVLGQKAARGVWLGAALGGLGVLALSAGQILQAGFKGDLTLGILLVFGSVVTNALGNVCNRLGQQSGMSVTSMTGWSMLYGAGAMLVYGLITGVRFNPPVSLAYWAGFLYLSLFGSILAFLLYYQLAQKRGFALASYVGVLTPPVAMIASSLFEKVRWDLSALVGLAAIVAGQIMIVRQAAQASS